MTTVGSLFTGAGLLDIGLHQAGFRHEWMCEADPWRRALLHKRFPRVPVHADVDRWMALALAKDPAARPQSAGHDGLDQ